MLISLRKGSTQVSGYSVVSEVEQAVSPYISVQHSGFGLRLNEMAILNLVKTLPRTITTWLSLSKVLDSLNQV